MQSFKPTFDTSLEDLCLEVIEKSTKDRPVKANRIRLAYERMVNGRINIRRVQEAIVSLRAKGMPICANGNGYFWPKDEWELEDYIAVVKKRVKELSISLAALKKSYGQIAINTQAVIEAD